MGLSTSKLLRKICSNAGFTLIEMMVACGILSMLMLGFSGYMYYQTRMNKTQENRQNINYVQSSVLDAAGQQETLLRSEKLPASPLK